MNPLKSIAATLLLCGSAFAGGTTDATAHLPMGHFNVWEMIDAADLVTGTTQFISVEKTTVVDGQTRYNVRTKIFEEVADVIFQFGIEGTNAYLYGARVASGEADFGDDKISVSTMFFEPKVFLGSTTTVLDADPVVTPITSSIKFKIKIGPKTFSGKVDVGGSVSTSWQSVGDVVTPQGTISGADLAQLTMSFDFTYSSEDDDINDEIEDEETHKTVRAILGSDRGFVKIDGAGGSSKVLNRAILPNTTVGTFPPLTVDLQQLLIDTPGLFNLFYGGGAEGGDPTDGFITLSNVTLDQKLGGKTSMTADISVATPGEGSLSVPVNFTGKTKFKKDGSALVSLKGKTAHPELLSKLNMKVKATLTEDSTQMLLTYKAGKDAFKVPIVGEIMIPVSTEAVPTVTLDINQLLDIKFDPNPLKRKLGAEGLLTVGSKIIPVILTESVKVKEGFPEKRSYKLEETETGANLMKFAGSNSDATDYVMSKMSAKLLGAKIKVDPTTLDVTLDDV